jgi:hypothetical protein
MVLPEHPRYNLARRLQRIYYERFEGYMRPLGPESKLQQIGNIDLGKLGLPL